MKLEHGQVGLRGGGVATFTPVALDESLSLFVSFFTSLRRNPSEGKVFFIIITIIIIMECKAVALL